MTNDRLRLLYLTNAFPPGVSGRFPSINPAGHATETRTAQSLGRRTEISTVGLLPPEVFGNLEPKDDSLGLEHELLLWEKEPALWHRWRSWRILHCYYLRKTAKEGVPDVLLVRNLTPVFNRFVRWLRRQQPRPVIVLVLADSSTLGRKVSLSRRLRYAFKPMQTLDHQAILWYDACISFGIGTRRHFEPRKVPWMWMPSSFNFSYTPPPPDPDRTGPIRFGYFGALAEHAAVIPMVREYLNSGVSGTLHVCGFGALSGTLRELAARHANFRFDGLLRQQSDCLAWAEQVDVLINPRLPIWGLENSFPSKIFEFGITGKAILSTRTGGVDEVLGEEGIYLDTEKFEDSLRHKLREVAGMNRAELQRRGAAIRSRLLRDFNWDEQARRMVEFLTGIVHASRVSQPDTETRSLRPA
jgi:glycosyltransferase involved in cell wall biosynthesis